MNRTSEVASDKLRAVIELIRRIDEAIGPGAIVTLVRRIDEAIDRGPVAGEEIECFEAESEGCENKTPRK